MGAVNIFLGGTGKFIAEDIQDALDFYDDKSISEPVAFDLNATIRPGVQLRGFVSADQQTIAGVARLASEWAAREPGRRLGPASGSNEPGPQIVSGQRVTPEHTPLTRIGAGIAANPAPTAGLFALRAHGLAVFSMLFDDRHARAGAGPGNELRQHIADRVREETHGGEAPRINIVTSTAGGTGAGMVIPLALWLREEYPNSPLNLIAVTASAFASVLRDAPGLEDIRAKGLSGTYALLRELSFFRDVDSRTEFPERRLPVTAKGLGYRPGTSGQSRDATGNDAGSELFDRIYWFGGRDGGSRDDAFREAEPLLRVLSADQPAADLHAETGQAPLQWVGAATAVEYPKLRLQRRMVYGVLEDAYRSLREAPGRFAGADAAGDGVSLLDYVGADTARPLGAWLHARRDTLLQGHAVTTGDADALIGAVQRAAEVGDYDSIRRGTDIGSGYDSTEDAWTRRYVPSFVKGPRERASDYQQRLTRAVGDLRREEETAFAVWLQGTVYGEWLSEFEGREPRATGEALEMLDALEGETDELAERFGDDELFPGMTIGAADDLVQQAEQKFEKPDYQAAGQAAKTTGHDRLISLGAAAMVGVIGAIVARPIADAIPEFAGGLSQYLPWVAVVVLAILTRWIVTEWRLHDRLEVAKPENVRRAAEDALIRAYASRDRVRALRWLQQELRGQGAQQREPFFEALRQRIMSARAEVQRLDEIYKGLQARAAAEVSGGGEQPAHVREEVGDCLADDPRMAERIRPQVRQRIAVEPAGAGLRLRLRHIGRSDRFNPVGEDAVDLHQALTAVDQAGLVDAARALENWENAAWSLVNWQLGEHLPPDFDTAMLRCENNDAAAALRSLTSKLQNLELPKAPSVALRSSAGVPEQRRIYAGSIQILARLNEALNDSSLTGAQRETLTQYQINPMRVVPALGEQIVFLDLWADPGGSDWAPHVIGNAVEARRAQETYYSAAGTAPATTAASATFTVIPELLAATKIEMGTGTVEPLAPAVVARLLGCDLDMQGPTYAELFYLLRHRGLLRSRSEGAGPEARTVTVIGDGDDSEAMPLVSRPVGAVPDAASGDGRPAFGDGRAAVIDFDTFVEFMRYGGQTLMAGQGPGFSPFPNAEPHVRDWAAAPARVAALQRMAVGEWYEGDVEGDAAAMIEELARDVAAMGNGDAAVRSSWDRAMRRLLAGDERKAIRRTHLSPGAGGEPLRLSDAAGA